MNIKSATTLHFLSACLLLTSLAWAGNPVKKDKSKTVPVKVDDAGNLVLITRGPDLQGPVALEFEERFFRPDQSLGPQSAEPYASYVTAVRFVDYHDHHTYGLTWNPFGGDALGLNLIDDKNLLVSPDHRWVAIPIYQHSGIYFEKVDTLPHSLETNQAAGFRLTCKDGKGQPFGSTECTYQILDWTCPHTVSLRIYVPGNIYNLKVDLETRTVEGPLPDKMTQLDFGPMENLGAKKIPNALPAVNPKGNAPVVPLAQDPNQARVALDSVKSLTADIYYYLATSNDDSSEIRLKFERHSGQKSFADLLKLLQSLRLSYPGKYLGKDRKDLGASSAASVTTLVLHPSTGDQFTLVLDGESSVQVEDKDGIYFFRRMDHPDSWLFFQLLDAADVQKSEKTELKAPPPMPRK